MRPATDFSRYILRDLSWLEFNDRVLQEGMNPHLPLGERLRFLAIVSSNLDEYFKVRVASAMQQYAQEMEKHSAKGTFAGELLKQIARRTHRLVDDQTEGILTALYELPQYGLNIQRFKQLRPQDTEYFRTYFETNILPILTPLAVEDLSPGPLLPSLQLHVALWLRVPVEVERSFRKKGVHEDTTGPMIHPGMTDDLEPSDFLLETGEEAAILEIFSAKHEKEPESGKRKKAENPSPGNAKKNTKKGKKNAGKKEKEENLFAFGGENEEPSETGEDTPKFVEKLAVIPVPTHISRLLKASETQENTDYILLDSLIAANADMLFPGCEVLASAIFRITRDEDVTIRDDEVDDMPKEIRNALLLRKRRSAVRLELTAGADKHIRERLMRILELDEEDVYQTAAPLDATLLMEVADMPTLKKARYEDWPAVEPYDLLESEDIFQTVAQQDVMLFHPYEKFDPVVELLEKAAEDLDVLAIKQTLYRTSGDSAIVRALKKAAENKKEVVVLVELKARFDEARNVEWAEQLENAGCHVIYGVAGLKTHAKAMLIIRRERGRIQRYVHLSTGNYNEKTAKLYSDIGLMTAQPEIAADVSAFFNMLTGYSEAVGWHRLVVEPFSLKRRCIELIEREMDNSTPELPGHIRLKLNSLEDTDMIEALYRASRRGVKIEMNIRGICCLRPGIPGLSENIEVRSIIDRYLEHGRIFEFHNGGRPEIYLASADWMTRNLERRLEIIFPILSPAIKRRLSELLDIYFSDNVKAKILRSDGRWESLVVPEGEELVRAQQVFYENCVAASTTPSHPPVKYVPLERKDK